MGVIQRLIPPFLYDALRSMLGARRAIWDGVYPDFSNTPRCGAGFSGDEWIAQFRQRMAEIEAENRSDHFAPWHVTGENSLLPLLVGANFSAGQRVRILDFGGGMGVSYAYLRDSLTQPPNMQYVVVETPEVCRAANRIFEDDDCIRFENQLPPCDEKFDVVYVCTALQYMEDYTDCLEKLCRYGAKYLLLANLSAGQNPTYATVQLNVPGSQIPYWFLHGREVVELMESQGYTLVFKDSLEREYDQRNFEESYRLGRACDLLFMCHNK